MEHQSQSASTSPPATLMVTLFFWPLLWTQAWFTMAGAVAGNRRQETDRANTDGQLPVPDPIQDSMDSEIFA